MRKFLLKSTHRVPHDERESLFCRTTKVCTPNCANNVGISIDEPHELFKAPKTALTHTDQAFRQIIVVFSQCFFNAFQNV